MKKLITLLLAVVMLLNISPVLGESADAAAMQRAREALEKLGYPVSDRSYAMVLEQHRRTQEWYAQADVLPLDTFASQSNWVYQLLLWEGLGEYDYDALTWMPTSDKIYVFDVEFFNIEGMYTEFLQGVQAIMPETKITGVREDLSGMHEDLEGERKVFFECNDHSYVVTLKSQGDWLDTGIIDFLNQVLKVEGFEKQLHIVSDAWDQIVFLIYGTEEDAAALRRLMGVKESTQFANPLMDWLSSILGI